MALRCNWIESRLARARHSGEHRREKPARRHATLVNKLEIGIAVRLAASFRESLTGHETVHRLAFRAGPQVDPRCYTNL